MLFSGSERHGNLESESQKKDEAHEGAGLFDTHTHTQGPLPLVFYSERRTSQGAEDEGEMHRSLGAPLREGLSRALRPAAARLWLWLLELLEVGRSGAHRKSESDPRLAFEMDHIMTFTAIRALTGLQLGPGNRAPRPAPPLESLKSRGFRWSARAST